MAGRIKDEDVTYIRDHSEIDDVVGDYVQLKNDRKLFKAMPYN